jgi:hypothetical protein
LTTEGNSNSDGEMTLPRLRIEWRVNVITLGALLLSMATGGTMVYAEVVSTKDDMAETRSDVAELQRTATAFNSVNITELKETVTRQGATAGNINDRVIRLETRMDVIIEQNKQILIELRAGP